MKRSLFFAYGVICYLMFLGIYAYFCAFTANVLTPWTIDAPVVGSWQSAFVINLALLAAFGIQHSVMARPAFKRRWTRVVPQPIERSTYVLASVIVTALLVWQWRPIDARTPGKAARGLWNASPPSNASLRRRTRSPRWTTASFTTRHHAC